LKSLKSVGGHSLTFFLKIYPRALRKDDVSSSVTKVLRSNSALGIQQR